MNINSKTKFFILIIFVTCFYIPTSAMFSNFEKVLGYAKDYYKSTNNNLLLAFAGRGKYCRCEIFTCTWCFN